MYEQRALEFEPICLLALLTVVIGIAAGAAIAGNANFECHASQRRCRTFERDADGVTTAPSAPCAALAATHAAATRIFPAAALMRGISFPLVATLPSLTSRASASLRPPKRGAQRRKAGTRTKKSERMSLDSRWSLPPRRRGGMNGVIASRR